MKAIVVLITIALLLMAISESPLFPYINLFGGVGIFVIFIITGTNNEGDYNEYL